MPPTDAPLTDAERYPLLTEGGERMLLRLREHPQAPRYNFRCGDRLTGEGLSRVQEYERLLATEAPPAVGEPPAWLEDFTAACRRDVPHYRAAEEADTPFAGLPTTCAADLRHAPWRFVPDGAELEELVVYNTSGTTGAPTDVPSHPEAAALYLPLLRHALAACGVALSGGADRVAVAVVAYRRRTLTYASVSAYLEQAGVLKLNLHPADWRDSDDRAAFLAECAPEVYTGDPVAFAELAALPLHAKPRALVSTAMALLPGLRRELEARFECPVLDLYSLTEVGPVAVADPEREGVHRLLQPRLYVELLDEGSRPVAAGARGEITVTGGINRYLPLLRYRTGDYAARPARPEPALLDLQGRAPVVFRASNGQPVSTVDIAGALRSFSLAAFTLRQAADGSLTLETTPAHATTGELEAALRPLFGPDAALTARVGALDGAGGKGFQYISELG